MSSLETPKPFEWMIQLEVNGHSVDCRRKSYGIEVVNMNKLLKKTETEF